MSAQVTECDGKKKLENERDKKWHKNYKASQIHAFKRKQIKWSEMKWKCLSSNNVIHAVGEKKAIDSDKRRKQNQN